MVFLNKLNENQLNSTNISSDKIAEPIIDATISNNKSNLIKVDFYIESTLSSLNSKNKNNQQILAFNQKSNKSNLLLDNSTKTSTFFLNENKIQNETKLKSPFKHYFNRGLQA